LDVGTETLSGIVSDPQLGQDGGTGGTKLVIVVLLQKVHRNFTLLFLLLLCLGT